MLPETGIGLETERVLSPIFIATDAYGTRCTTVIERDHDGRSHFYERTYARDGSYSDVNYEGVNSAS